MIKYATFTVKRNLKKALDKVNGLEGKLDYAIFEIDQSIVKLADARTACHKAKLTDKVILIEEKIKNSYAKKQEIIAKKADYIAKAKCLEAQIEAAKALGKCNISFDCTGLDSTIAECDEYIKNLESELSTMDFMTTL